MVLWASGLSGRLCSRRTPQSHTASRSRGSESGNEPWKASKILRSSSRCTFEDSPCHRRRGVICCDGPRMNQVRTELEYVPSLIGSPSTPLPIKLAISLHISPLSQSMLKWPSFESWRRPCPNCPRAPFPNSAFDPVNGSVLQ